MRGIEIQSLPGILFAHVYSSDRRYGSYPVCEAFLEVSYVAEGSLLVESEHSSARAEAGDVIFQLHNTKSSVQSDSFHSHHTVGARVNWTFTEDEHGLFLPLITPKEKSKPVRLLIDDFIHNQAAYKASRALGAAKFLELLYTLDRCNRKAQNVDLPSDLLHVKRAKDYIQQNIHTCITQKSIAEHLGVSPEYLCSVFKKNEDTTIMRYINKEKLKSIKALMDNQNMHLYEAASIYGYTDANYVSRLHKQLFGYKITDKPQIHPEYEADK